MIGAADNLPQRKNAPYREIVLPAIYRVLYCCGLRVNEALRLRITDCNFKEGTLFVRNGKGGKDRIVPMHPTLTAYLSDYRSKLPGDTEWLFPSSRGHYSRSTVYENFREMLILCKIPHTGKGPRVHDFRHTFCVHTLEKQLAAGYEPMQIMPRMAAYLGHKSYRETSWYIHLTIVSFPAGGNALLIYETSVTNFAPLGPEATITNTATVTGNGFDQTAQETIAMEPRADLSISKALCPVTVTENGQLTYTFVIENAGSVAAAAADNVVLTDTFDPKLNSIAVTFNGTPWSEGVNYTYDTTTGLFQTLPGQITVPAATYTQKADGTWSVTPGVAVLTVTGTV